MALSRCCFALALIDFAIAGNWGAKRFVACRVVM
jgi:hypothetical protein